MKKNICAVAFLLLLHSVSLDSTENLEIDLTNDNDLFSLLEQKQADNTEPHKTASPDGNLTMTTIFSPTPISAILDITNVTNTVIIPAYAPNIVAAAATTEDEEESIEKLKTKKENDSQENNNNEGKNENIEIEVDIEVDVDVDVEVDIQNEAVNEDNHLENDKPSEHAKDNKKKPAKIKRSKHKNKDIESKIVQKLEHVKLDPKLKSAHKSISNMKTEKVDAEIDDIWKLLESGPDKIDLSAKKNKSKKDTNAPTCKAKHIKSNKPAIKKQNNKKKVARKPKIDKPVKIHPVKLKKKKDHREHTPVKVNHNKKIHHPRQIMNTRPNCAIPKKEQKRPNCAIPKKKQERPVKKFHTLPAKKQRSSCLSQKTVIIPSQNLTVPTIPPPAFADIRSNFTQYPNRMEYIYDIKNDNIDNINYNGYETKFNGGFGITKTVTFTQLTVVPVLTTSTQVVTSSIVTPTTRFFTEIRYTPYTVTTTSTDTMYMMKVTTVTKGALPGGCNACELDANGMVIPAGQLPPGIFATPINQIDTQKFDIIGYAGINPTNFNPNIQGYQIPRTRQ